MENKTPNYISRLFASRKNVHGTREIGVIDLMARQGDHNPTMP
jgi:hypothetical protein